jgi:hypothetical protein
VEIQTRYANVDWRIPNIGIFSSFWLPRLFQVLLQCLFFIFSLVLRLLIVYYACPIIWQKTEELLMQWWDIELAPLSSQSLKYSSTPTSKISYRIICLRQIQHWSIQ